MSILLLPELDLEILYQLDIESLYEFCLTNTSVSRFCFNDPILKKRIDDYVLELKIYNYLEQYENQTISFVFNQDYHTFFPSHIADKIDNYIYGKVKSWGVRLSHRRDIYQFHIKLVLQNQNTFL